MALRVGSRLRLRHRQAILAVCLLAPAVLLRSFTSIYPFLRTAYLSFLDYNLISRTHQWIGMGNFVRIANDFAVVKGIEFTILFVVVSTVGEIVLGLGLALLLNANSRMRQLGRIANLMPWAVAMITAAIAFRWLLDPQYGMMNDLLSRTIGLRLSLLDPWGARSAVILTNVWKNAPFVAIIFLAGLQGIPAELSEAAKVDGASLLQVFRHITLPMLKPLMTTMAIFFLVWQLATFDLIYGMTGGGPGFATSVLAHRVFLVAFGSMDFGYASAIGMLLFFCVVVVGVVGLIIWRKQQVVM